MAVSTFSSTFSAVSAFSIFYDLNVFESFMVAYAAVDAIQRTWFQFHRHEHLVGYLVFGFDAEAGSGSGL
jgi:hypothetical protein